MISNRKLLLPYAAPYLAYVVIASALADFTSIEVNYMLRIIAVVGLLVWAWKWYIPLTGPRSPVTSVVTGVLAGLLGTVIWVLLLLPMAETSETAPWSPAAFTLRLLSATLLVPVFEELIMRGFIFRLAYQWGEARKNKVDQPLATVLDERSIDKTPSGAWSWTAVIVSTLVFTSGHHMSEWPASIAYGLLMCALLIVRKDLLCCIVAHAVTNLGLALYVLKTGNWYLW